MRWPLSDALREKIRSQLATGRYDRAAVAAAAGFKGAAMLSQIINPKWNVKSSEGLPGICRALDIDIYEYLPLSDEQRRILRALDAVQESAPAETSTFVKETESRARGIVAVEKTRSQDDDEAPSERDDDNRSAADSSPSR